MTKKIIKLIITLILLAILGFLLLNFGYFRKQASYFLNKNFVVSVPTQTDDHLNNNLVKTDPDQLSIPSLRISAPIQYPTQANEAAYQEALVNGVVHFPGTAGVGELGNVYIFGHSSDFAFNKGSYKTVFALLPKIEIDSDIFVSDSNGKQYQYKVFEKFVVEKTDLSVLSQETNDRSILTIQTSYPVGTALKRYIVKAELVTR